MGKFAKWLRRQSSSDNDPKPVMSAISNNQVSQGSSSDSRRDSTGSQTSTSSIKESKYIQVGMYKLRRSIDNGDMSTNPRRESSTSTADRRDSECPPQARKTSIYELFVGTGA